MRKHTVTFEPGSVVRIPFPFTDRATSKRRPALVLSTKEFNASHKNLVMAMITSAANPSWPSDVPIKDQKSAGLPAPSVVRMKLFTLDERLIIGALGMLSRSDQAATFKQVGIIFGVLLPLRNK